MTNAIDEDEQILAVSERHHQIMMEGKRFFDRVFVILLLAAIVVCGAIVGYFIYT